MTHKAAKTSSPSPVAPASLPPVPKAPSVKKDFLLFISIPAGIIFLVVLVLVVPSLFAKPQYDFIYSSCPGYECAGIVVGKDGLDRTNGWSSFESGTREGRPDPDLYYYNIRKNASKKISFAEADTYTLDSSNISPEGYSLARGNGSDGGFLLWGYDSDDQWYIKKSSLQKKPLNVESGYRYSSSLTLIGWVEK